jgi:phosphate/sulfate permease
MRPTRLPHCWRLVLPCRRAIVLATVCNLLGALLTGTAVANTYRRDRTRHAIDDGSVNGASLASA